MSTIPPERIPVIVGVGEVVDRGRDPLQGKEPLALMELALRAAEQDAAAPLLRALDSIDIVAEYSWPYADAAALLGERLGVRPRHAVYGEAGGESPVRFIQEAALRIASGEATVAAVVGAEATYTVAAAKKAGVTLPWTPRDRGVKLKADDYVNPLAVRHGVAIPTNVYPFYENATQAAWGQTQREALEESASLWSRFSEAAAANPNAWLPRALDARQIRTPSEGNRLIAWPYTKSMVANPMVNQGAAVLLTSVALARQLGIPEERYVYLWGGASANEPRDYLQRDQYFRSDAQDVVLEAATSLAGGDAGAFDFIELYSCFPCVPKMARRTLGLSSDACLSVTGGLSFFGAPLNNYMTHAAASLVRHLRTKSQGVALLYGQGEYVTKHHALVLGSAPRDDGRPEVHQLSAAANLRSGVVPRLLLEYSGPANVETFTIVHGREGEALFGTVIARTPAGDRLMARVPGDDRSTLGFLTDLDRSPVGTAGVARMNGDGLGEWSISA